MQTIVWTDELSRRPLGEVLASAPGEELHIQDASGNLMATIVVAARQTAQPTAVEVIGADIEEIRRRSQGSLADAISTEEFVARLRSLSPE